MLVEISKIGKQEAAVVSSLDIAETFGKEHNTNNHLRQHRTKHLQTNEK